jgi:Ca-activated chloride channel homolog
MLFLYIYVQQRRSRYSVRFTNVNLLANVVKARPRWRRHVPALFFLAAICVASAGSGAA